jgi:hypothetical protein
MKPQPYTAKDFEKGEQIVRELHGIKGFNGWAERVAKALAEERERVLYAVA